MQDVYRNSEVAEIVYAMDQQGCKLQRIADHLVQNSLLKGSMDNVTCVIIRINIYAARALSELLPPHLQQQIQLDANSSNANGVRTASRQSGTPKYDAKAWVGAEDDGELDSGLNGVSVYYPPGSIGGAGAASPYGSGSTASASRGGVGQEEEAAKKQSSSKQLSRSRSTNRLNKGSSKRATPDPYGTDVDVAGVDGDSGSFARRNSKQQNLNLNVTLSGGDTGESAYAASRAGKDSSQQGQMPFPISAYRSMHRPFTQASASTSGSGSVPSQQLEAVGRTPNVQKALFVPSAYASQVSAQGAAGEESPYSGGRSYTLLGGNSMVPVRDSGGGYARPNTSNAENNYLSAQRGYVSKRPDSYSNSRFVDSSARPNSAAPVLNHKVQTSASRYSGMSAQQQEQVREFPPPHSPISTGRNSRK